MPPLTRLQYFINNRQSNSLWADMPIATPVPFHYYFDDFHYFRESDYDTSGSSGNTTTALVDGDTSSLSVISDSGNGSKNLFLNGQAFEMSADKKFWMDFGAKELTELTNEQFFFGLFNSVTSPTDGVFFFVSGGVVEFDYLINGVETFDPLKEVGVGNDFRASFYYDGRGTISLYVDDVKIDTIDATVTGLPNGLLSPAIVLQPSPSGEGASIDYWLFAGETDRAV